MQGLVVVDLIVVDTERRRKMCQSHWSMRKRSRSPCQGTCRVSTSRWSTMQGFVVVGLIVEEILNVSVKCVKVCAARNIGQGHRVKVSTVSTLVSYICQYPIST